MLSLRAVRKGDDSAERIELILNGPDLAPQLDLEPIYFELCGSDATDVGVLDGFVGGIIHYLMESRQDLHIEGKVTDTCLRNLTQYQRFWSLIHPTRCSRVRITADEIVPDRGVAQYLPAVANYSGGIDSTFTIARHSLRLCGMDTKPPAAALIVHGFDVPLADKHGFARLLDRLQPVIEEYGLRRYVVRTNLKELALQNWLDSYSAQLVGCLHTVSHRHSVALVASDGYGQSPMFDFGGNAIAVPLLSTSRLKVFYDGACYGRTDKVRLIAKYPKLRRSLKFCWQGPDVDRNCGRCPKCLLTYMNFRAVGIENPECFDAPIADASVASFSLRNETALILAHEVLGHLWKMPKLADLTAQFSAPVLRFEEEARARAIVDGAQGENATPVPPAETEFAHRCGLSLATISALNGGAVVHEADCTRIEFDPRAWAYSAGISLESLAEIAGPARVEIRMQVDGGRIGILVLKRGSSEETLTEEKSVKSSPGSVTLKLDIPAMANAGDLVFRGWPSREACRARILAVDVLSDSAEPVSVS
jgi:hypothetical protein